MSSAIPDINALKTRLKATWSAGDFGRIAESYEKGARRFVERLDIQPGMRVLDVACGTGNLSFPAALAGAKVTGVDIAPNLLEQARARAKDEGLGIDFDEGDAEALPYKDASFDVVMTMFGAMFAPRPEVTASELLRVCRSGGRIAMANWTPSGFIGQMFKITAGMVPPPQGMPSPVLWGDPAKVKERLASGASAIETTPRMMRFEFPFGPKEVVEHFRLYYGPTQKAFGALEESRQPELRRQLEEIWSKHNQGASGTSEVDSEYLEVLATRA
jgi:ubiquinone/menaquinone biosynthesis C-methylase UbiE